MKTLILTAAALSLSFGILTSAEAGNGKGNFRGNGGGHRVQFNQGNKFIGSQQRFVQQHNVQKFHVPQHNIQKQIHQPHFNGNQNFHNKFIRNVVIAAPKYNHGLVHNQNYHIQHARRFDYGYCYSGPTHTHWVSTGFSHDLGCTVYFCPCTQVWYYWCPLDNCFYPITYCPHGKYVF